MMKGSLDFGDTAAREVSQRIYGFVDAETDLDNIPAIERVDGMLAVVLGDQTMWVFDKDSVAAEATGKVRQPASGDGRWLKSGANVTTSLTSSQAHIDLDPQDFILLTGAPLAIFADGASAVPGTAVVDSKASAIRWNNNATLDAIMTSFRVPADMDITANATLTIFASKVGATLADAVTFDVGAFNQVVGALHDADADFGGTSSAMTGNAATKTIQSVTRTLALANLAASPASVTLTIKPTNGTLGTDDLVFLGARVTYTSKLLT
jgi:hypothetical protein